MATAAASQDLETEWSEGGAILVEARGRSEPPRHLEVSTPGRGAEENMRPRSGPEYPLYGPSTSHHYRPRYPFPNTAPILTPQSTVTASVDGPVGYASLELAVLACPRSIRCLYRNKDFRCLTKLCALSTALAARTLPGMDRANATASGGTTRERTTSLPASNPPMPMPNSHTPPTAHVSAITAALCALGGKASRLLYVPLTPSSGVRPPISWEPGCVEEAGDGLTSSERSEKRNKSTPDSDSILAT